MGITAGVAEYLAINKPGRPAMQLVPIATAPVAQPAATAAEQHYGCGWFDSTYELNEGLAIEEVDPTLFQLWASAAARHLH